MNGTQNLAGVLTENARWWDVSVVGPPYPLNPMVSLINNSTFCSVVPSVSSGIPWIRRFGFGGSAAWNTVPGSRPPPGSESFFRESPVFRPCLSIVWLASQPLQLASLTGLPGLGGKAHFG